MKKHLNKKGFSLIHILVSIGVFVVFSFGLITTLHLLFKVIHVAKTQTILQAAVSDDLEGIQNLAYADIGILNSIPEGVLEKTRTTTVDGIEITITRTVRFVDSPVDGTTSSDPQDLSPADYKHIIVEATCQSCREDLVETVGIYLYADHDISAQNTGSLIVHAANTRGEPLPNTQIVVQSLTQDPHIRIVDTTDAQGKLHLLQLPTGVEEYTISATKNGYTNAQTLVPNEGTPTPIAPPATIAEYQTTEKTLTLDKPAQVSFYTKNTDCTPAANKTITLTGATLVGNNPDIQLFSENTVSDLEGFATYDNLFPDTFNTRVVGHDIVGTIPQTIDVLSGSLTENITLFLGADSEHSLLVSTKDANHGGVIPNATARLSLNDTTTEVVTHGTNTIQSNWADGPGQSLFTETGMYWSQTGSLNTNQENSLSLSQSGAPFLPKGTLESSIFNLGENPNTITEIIIHPKLQQLGLGHESVGVQIASASTTTVDWHYVGPDGTPNTYYLTTQGILPNTSDQYIRYKTTLQTPSSTLTPTIDHIGFIHTESCGAPGQAYFGNLSENTYSLEVSAPGYQTTQQQVSILGDTALTMTLTPN